MPHLFDRFGKPDTNVHMKTPVQNHHVQHNLQFFSLHVLLFYAGIMLHGVLRSSCATILSISYKLCTDAGWLQYPHKVTGHETGNHHQSLPCKQRPSRPIRVFIYPFLRGGSYSPSLLPVLISPDGYFV